MKLLFLQTFHGSRTVGKKTWFPRFHGSTVLLGDRGTVDRGLRIMGQRSAHALPVVKVTRRPRVFLDSKFEQAGARLRSFTGSAL